MVSQALLGGGGGGGGSSLHLLWSCFLSPPPFILDVMVWTNGHVMKWVESIGLDSYAPNLKETGVHGGVLALDNDFDHEKLAMALKMPQTDTEVRVKGHFVNHERDWPV